MRTLLIVGNWKMNKTASEAEPFVRRLVELVPTADPVEVVLAPPFTAIQAASQGLPASRPFGLAGQDLFWEDQGPFTGEVSASMLKDLGCGYVILGHSERRHHFNEQDEGVNRKVRAALRSGLRPIFCLGETLEQHDASHAQDVVTRQLMRGLDQQQLAMLVMRLQGFTVAEISEEVGRTERTVHRDWEFAKSWLRLELGIDDGE